MRAVERSHVAVNDKKRYLVGEPRVWLIVAVLTTPGGASFAD